MKPYLDWSAGESIEEDFEAPEALKDAELLFGLYSYVDYEGSAFVLFRKNGKLYEVNGSHCSCHGLEGQWSPEETTVEALRHRIVNNPHTRFFDEDIKHLAEVLDAIDGNNLASSPQEMATEGLP